MFLQKTWTWFPYGAAYPHLGLQLQGSHTLFWTPLAPAHQHTHGYVPTAAQIPSQREAKRNVYSFTEVPMTNWGTIPSKVHYKEKIN